MKKIFILVILILICQVSYAEECIVNTITNEVREWTAGVYASTPPMSADEELKTFKTIPERYDKVLKYENGDIVVTNDDLPEDTTARDNILKELGLNVGHLQKIKNLP